MKKNMSRRHFLKMGGLALAAMSSIFVVCRFQGIRNEIRFLASFNRQKAFCIKSCRGNH